MNHTYLLLLYELGLFIKYFKVNKDISGKCLTTNVSVFVYRFEFYNIFLKIKFKNNNIFKNVIICFKI